VTAGLLVTVFVLYDPADRLQGQSIIWCVFMYIIMQDAGGMYFLGICYERGLGTGRNEARAAELYRGAASRGHSSAMYNLAVFFEHGIGGIPTLNSQLQIYRFSDTFINRLGWWHGIVVTRSVRSTKLLYARPG